MTDFVVALFDFLVTLFNLLIPAFVVGFYALFWALSRWQNIALPTRKQLRAQIDGVKAVLETSTDAPGTTNNALQALLNEAKTSLDNSSKVEDFLFWSRGQEIAAWRVVHEVERRLVGFSSLASVKADLVSAEADLRKIGSDRAIALADKIKALIQPPKVDLSPIPCCVQICDLLGSLLQKRLKKYLEPCEPCKPCKSSENGTVPPSPELESLRSHLQAALRIIYDYRDTEYCKLTTWYTKAAWLMVVSLTAIFFILTFHTGSAWLLGVGAVGGILSRLTRSIRKRKPVPTDYGAYWTSFYLAPVFGALAAWAGILLIVGLAEFNILSGPFERVQWGNFSYNDGIFGYITDPKPTSSAGVADEGQPLTLSVQAQLSFSSNTQTTAIQAIEQPNSETADNSNEEDINKNVLLTLALALLLGFSERRLTQLTGQLDGAFEPKEEKAKT